MITDQTGTASSEMTTTESTMTSQSDQEKTTIENSPINNEPIEADNRFSLSFADLVETMFSKKESKPIETIEQAPTSMNGESQDTRTTSDELESETQINNSSEDMS